MKLRLTELAGADAVHRMNIGKEVNYDRVALSPVASRHQQAPREFNVSRSVSELPLSADVDARSGLEGGKGREYDHYGDNSLPELPSSNASAATSRSANRGSRR